MTGYTWTILLRQLRKFQLRRHSDDSFRDDMNPWGYHGVCVSIEAPRVSTYCQTNWSKIGSLHGCSVDITICILILSLDPQGGVAGLGVELKDVLT